MAAARRKWTEIELALLKAYGGNYKEVARLTNRSLSSVKARSQHHNKLKNNKRYYKGRTFIMPVEDHPPPPYCVREREIRYSIPPASLSAETFGDPKPGYTGADNRKRKLSVPDAIEICALYSGHPDEIIALAATYRTTTETVGEILNGSWFDRLLPVNMRVNA